jgi:hypothetical protein
MSISTADIATPHGTMQFNPCLLLNDSDTDIQVQNSNSLLRWMAANTIMLAASQRNA